MHVWFYTILYCTNWYEKLIEIIAVKKIIRYSFWYFIFEKHILNKHVKNYFSRWTNKRIVYFHMVYRSQRNRYRDRQREKRKERKEKVEKRNNDITTKNFHKIPSGHIRHVGQSLPPLQFPAGFYRGPFDQPHSTRKIENRFTTACIDHETMSLSYFLMEFLCHRQ